MRRGFLYLVALMDWHSRKVLGWRLSNSMDARFCVEAVTEALVKHRPPEICNFDPGSQSTSTEFTEVLLDAKVKISMDGRGRRIDNRRVDRLWRTLKYECVSLNASETGSEARRGIGAWISSDTEKDRHSSHRLLMPGEAYDTANRNLKAAA